MSSTRTAQAVALCIAAIVAGCDETPPEDVERVRAIKPYYVVEPAGGDVRRYSGTIAATNTSALSFAVSGTVRTVVVKKGDRVVKGQVLATLDPKPFKLNVQAAPGSGVGESFVLFWHRKGEDAALFPVSFIDGLTDPFRPIVKGRSHICPGRPWFVFEHAAPR